MADSDIVWDEIDKRLDITLSDTYEKPKHEGQEEEHFLDTSESDTRKNLSAKHCYTFLTTAVEQKKCCTGNIVCLDDDRIVISDFQWSQLNVFDKDYDFCFSKRCHPRAEITHYSGNEIALTSRDLRKVLFYAVEKKRIVQLPKILDVKYKTYGVKYGNKHFGLLMVSDMLCYHILNDVGVEVGKIRTELGNNPLTPSKYYAMDPTEKKFYVSDQINSNILIMSYTGETLYKQKVFVSTPCGIILLEKVIVVIIGNEYMWRLTPVHNYYTVQSFINKEDNVGQPVHMALQHRRKCIIVGSDKKNYSDVVKSFQVTWSE